MERMQIDRGRLPPSPDMRCRFSRAFLNPRRSQRVVKRDMPVSMMDPPLAVVEDTDPLVFDVYADAAHRHPQNKTRAHPTPRPFTQLSAHVTLMTRSNAAIA